MEAIKQFGTKPQRKPFPGLLCLLLCALLVLAPSSRAQELPPSSPPSPTATVRAIDKPELYQALHDLTNPWTVMCVAAHPDDEDGTTLTILRRKYGLLTVSLFSTYGEGGQNAVGPELYEELGVIRARETIEASKIQGSEPYFLGLRDFGFSKSAEETFRVWGHDEALRRMVLKIRELRPDIIITNHDTSRGHGHHQATGRLILEAFDAAADPNRFTEQLQRLTVWQPSRLFVRSRVAGGSGAAIQSTGNTENLITVDPNERDPTRGKIYADQALAALRQHASQGPWPKTIAERMRGETSLPLIRYALVREAPSAKQLPGAAKTFLEGLSLPETISARLAAPTIDSRPLTEFIEEPDKVLNALIGWRRQQGNTTNIAPEHSHRLRLITERGNRALGLTSGVTLILKSNNSLLVPGNPARFTVSLDNTGDRTVDINRLSFLSWGTRAPLDAAEQLVADTETSNTVDRVTPTTAMPTVPLAHHLYDGKLFGERFVADADLDIDGARFSLSAATKMDIAPAVEFKEISPSLYVLTPAIINRPLVIKIKLSNNLARQFRGTVKLSAPRYHIFEVGREIILEPYETQELTIRSNAIPLASAAVSRRARDGFGQFLLSVESEGSSQPIAQRFLHVVYSASRVVRDLRVGFIPSFDKTLEQSLMALGVNAQELRIEQLQTGELANYDTLIIDNRGYQAHAELIAANSSLLNYVREGGTLIVFYHKTEEWNPDPSKGRPQLAPFPIVLGNERVTQETAPVKFLEPEHRLLNFPNRITRADFDRWIQERGLYFPKEWDPKYQTLFETADDGEPSLKGGLLATKYGRGYYIYTSLVWYRQLGVGVPGAFRMFANMISYGHPKRKRSIRFHRNDRPLANLKSGNPERLFSK
ncbi:MAG: PIG-L family deacetylase [Pyrinomonadaceae bacterium]|nr:PIG-L family deacetylase [Pyrinomonadaceae bacterium]